MSVYRRLSAFRLALLILTVLYPWILVAQIATGTIAGSIRDPEGVPVQTAITISSELGFRANADTDAHGTFLLTLPYGRYELTVQDRVSPSSGVPIDIEPLQNREIKLIVDASGKLRIETQPSENAGVWAGSPKRELYPETFNFSGLMLGSEPATASLPLDFVGLGDNRLAWQSQRGFSWTGTKFEF